MKPLLNLLFGASRNERYVTITLILQFFIVLVLQIAEFIILSVKNAPDAGLDLQVHFTYFLGYVFLIDGFRSKNILQIKSYIVWLIFRTSILLLSCTLNDISNDSRVPMDILVIYNLEIATLFISMLFQLFFLRRVIHECVWRGFRFTGANREKQRLWSILQTFYVVLKLTGVFLLPPYFDILSSGEVYALQEKDQPHLYFSLIVFLFVSTVGLIICGVVFAKRESKAGMSLFYLLLLGLTVGNAHLAWKRLGDNKLMGITGATGFLWCLSILVQSIRVTINFGKGLLECFALASSPPQKLDLGDEEITELKK